MHIWLHILSQLELMQRLQRARQHDRIWKREDAEYRVIE
jgi:hypothetical protein